MREKSTVNRSSLLGLAVSLHVLIRPHFRRDVKIQRQDANWRQESISMRRREVTTVKAMMTALDCQEILRHLDCRVSQATAHSSLPSTDGRNQGRRWRSGRYRSRT